MRIADVQRQICEINEAKGWNDGEPFPVKLALMHSELSEALEEFRNGRTETYFVDTKPEGLGIELADCIIRILHWCGTNDIDIEECLRLKLDYNETRPYRHGGKVC